MECMCEDPAMMMTERGCRPNHEQDCMMPQSAYFPRVDVCREYHECPTGDMRTEGCRYCTIMNYFDTAAAPMMGCDDCHDGFHKWEYGMYQSICVRHDAENDCSALDAMPADPNDPTSVATVARPEGPPGCMRCVQVGHENMCQECDHANNFELDKYTMTCYERNHASHEMWYEQCPPDMEATCSVCAANEYVDDMNAIQVHHHCAICQPGFWKTTKG
jgi:hypothetical protein